MRSFSISIRGASHVKGNLPCQDASLDEQTDAVKTFAAAVVADGHGSPQYFRSNIGSSIAAEVALHGIKEFVSHNSNVSLAFETADAEKALNQLVRHIISSWFARVSDDEAASPLASDERLAAVEEKHKSRYLNDPNHQYFSHAYGTTLLAAALMEDYWFGLHIGDGKCVVLYDDGTWDQPIPWDEKCFLNSTTSLCDDDAISEFRYWFGVRQADGTFIEHRYGIDGQGRDISRIITHKPAAIFIGSDGVDDTYPVYENEKHLKHLYRNIVLSFAINGFDNTRDQILELAQRMAEHGSQDDISIAGIICDLSAHVSLVEKMQLETEADKAKNEAEDVRKKAEAKRNQVQAAKTKTDSVEKLAAKLRGEIQAVGQERERYQLHLRHLREGIKEQKKAIQPVGQECAVLQARFEKIVGDLRVAEDEEKQFRGRLRESEEELVSLESQAMQLEEKYQACIKKLHCFGEKEKDLDE